MRSSQTTNITKVNKKPHRLSQLYFKLSLLLYFKLSLLHIVWFCLGSGTPAPLSLLLSTPQAATNA